MRANIFGTAPPSCDAKLAKRLSKASVTCLSGSGKQNSRSQGNKLVGAPPVGFDYRRETSDCTQSIISARYPELQDLVRQGTLLAVPRASSYKERRTDGYQEPELVLLVGTVHVAQRSADAARRVIEATRPENVVLELCGGRTGVLYAADPNESMDHKSIHNSIRLSRFTVEIELYSVDGHTCMRQALQSTLNGQGSAASLLLLLLADRISSSMQRQAGMQAGMEMRAAKEAAEAVNAQIVLGDRPIRITVERVWRSLKWRSKLYLLKLITSGLTTALPTVSHKDVASIDSDEAVDAMTKQLTSTFPEVASAILHERDLYLSWSLKRSKAVNGSRVVVGIIGKGHMPGVVYHLLQDSSNLRFRDLAGTRTSSKDKKAWPQWLSVVLTNVALLYGFQALLERLRPV